jgi:hypothetical protein
MQICADGERWLQMQHGSTICIWYCQAAGGVQNDLEVIADARKNEELPILLF